MKKLLACILVLALAAPARPQAVANGGYARRIVTLYDLTQTAETYCALATNSTQGPGPIAAANSNTVTGSSTFGEVDVGTELQISQGGNYYLAAVEAKASASSITAAYRSPTTLASAALTLTNAQFSYRNITCGTGAENGKFSVGYGPFSVKITVYRLAATSISWRLLCRTMPGAGWTQVYPILTPPTTTASYIAVTAASVDGYIISSLDAFAECKVGMKIDTDSGVNAVSVELAGRAF